MKKISLLFIVICFFTALPLLHAQPFERIVVDVPFADSGAVKIDGVFNEPAWQNAAEINLITSSGFNIFMNYYGENRTDPIEPDYDEYTAKLLWSKDTLYVAVHIDEVVNDSSGLYWNGQWTGDQLFVSLSNRFAVDLGDDYYTYDGNVYAAPDGPYHYLIIGNQVTLNNGNMTGIPMQYRGCDEDSQTVFNAADYARWGITIDTITGVWNLELAIYHPGVNSEAAIGFNMGGSQGSRAYDSVSIATVGYPDAYAYYTWQPNTPNDPFFAPLGETDAGMYNLVTSEQWALLNFLSVDDNRIEMNVPYADSGDVVIDGIMNEAKWQDAAKINLITSSGFNIFMNYYGENRTDPIEPDYDEYTASLLWTEDTIYVGIHIDEVVNDSSGLYWNGQWTGDQVFVSLSNRFGVDLGDDYYTYDGNVYAAPDGPYHYLILGNQVTLNNGSMTGIPWEYRKCFNQSDSQAVFLASDYARWGVSIDTITGVWNLELAIYHPNAKSQGRLGFNIGGSQGSRAYDSVSIATVGYPDAYAYYTWQPNVPNDPFFAPLGETDAGMYNLVTSEYWAVLNLSTSLVGVKEEKSPDGPPTKFSLLQNYPNPFNPVTTIRFDVAKRSNVTLKVYNIVGQEVSTLINNQVLDAGVYSSKFNAANLASGIYFYELRTDDFVVTKKMVLLK